MFDMRAAALCLAFGFGNLAHAETPSWKTDGLLDLLGVGETIQIMRNEGMAYANELAADMVPSAPGPQWQSDLDRIYDPARMEAVVRAGFAQSYLANDVNLDRLERYYGSELGQDIVRLEISAREAMSDQAIEDAARAAYVDRAGGSPEEDVRLAELTRFVESNDLIEANVVGGLNTTVAFYNGLADGGAIQLSEEEILMEVWGSEEESRKDTSEWIYGFLLMAYRPLSDGQLSDYTDLTQTPEGQAMNRALFAGFDQMYEGISYALGLAIAQQMTAQEL